MNDTDSFLQTLLETLVPGAGDSTRRQVESMVAGKRPELRKKFALFLKIIAIFGRLRFLRPFARLDFSRRARLLAFFENSKLSLFRRGFWGLRSLAMIAYYGDLENNRKIGFSGPTRPERTEHPDGPVDPFAAGPNGGDSPSAPSRLEFDIVIIGSGAGGGTVAERLAPLGEKGARIAVLESGPDYGAEYFNQRELQMTRLFWDEGGLLNEEGTMTLAAGRMVGGSTPIYTGVTFDLPEDVYAKWRLEKPYADFQRRLRTMRAKLNAHVLTPEEINKNNRLFAAGARSAGMSVKDLDICTKGCQGSGFCNLGCVNNAKMSTMNVQLPAAIDAGVTVIPNCHVDTVAEGKLQARILPAPAGTRAGQFAPGDYEIAARRIVLAGGCFGTNVLLSKSQLPNVSDALGRYCTMHPALTVYGRHPEKIDGHRSFPKAYYVDDFSESENYYIETAFYYPGVSAKNIEGWGPEHARRMQGYTNLMCILLLNHDDPRPENRIGWKGRPVFDYSISDETIRSLCLSQIRAAEIFFAAGCDEVYVPFAPEGIVRKEDRDRLAAVISTKHYTSCRTVFASAHPQGGCRLGADPAKNVCDPGGRVHGARGLYVADASLFPSSSHVNPYLTVMGLADIVADTILQDEGFAEGS